MEHKDDSLPEEFIRAVERVCKELEPKNKENNALWHLVNDICKDIEYDEE
ncbi:hypothetical protein RGU12_01715 [Fredinandcohnia sp. QZ13]|nr:hypothetical protein [Fredinandcohnia sp. QZ13]MDR4886262.1 hypothetical protein [Fredinandcohnia sp. QZ13]